MTPHPVLILTTYYPPVLGGAETAAAQLATHLAAQGRRVTVITKRVAPAAQAPDDEQLDGVRVLRVGPRGPRTAWGKWVAAPAFLGELLRRRHEYGAVVCIDYRGIGLAALLARGRTNHPVILQAATDGVLSFDRVRGHLPAGGPWARRIADLVVWPLQRLYDGGDAYPCISRAIEAETLLAGVPRPRVIYLPNPVDVSTFAPADPARRAALRQQFGVPIDAKVAIVVGRLSREKGQMEALAAWRDAAIPGGVLVLVGPDMTGHPWDIGPAARQFVATHGLGDRVRFVGGVPASAVPDWFRVADVAVQPSHFEAFGTSAIEAMAAGVPVIASNVGGLPDFVEPGRNGLLVRPRHHEDLVEAMGRILGDDALRATLSAGARATAARFDTRLVLDEFARVIDAAIERRAASAGA